MAERDTQRSKLYAAERDALIAYSKPLPSVKDVEEYLRKQMRRATLKRRYGDAVDLKVWPIRVTDGRGTRHALAHGTRKISLPLWARHEWVVLHETAHIIHERLAITPGWRQGDRTRELAGGAAHGWQFAAVFLDLVRFCMGAEAGDALKVAFKARRVRFKPKRKPPAVSIVERLAAREKETEDA